MAFITDKEELKPGLILFRRTDVAHDNWYCRVKLPKQDRNARGSKAVRALALLPEFGGDVLR